MEKNKKSTCCGKCKKRNHVANFIGNDGTIFTKEQKGLGTRPSWLTNPMEVNSNELPSWMKKVIN